MAVDEAGNKPPQGPEREPSSLSAIGELLRRTREAKGLALAQAQMDTKIRTKYLEALESGNDAETPGVAYFKGFLRFYGNYLGLDGTALVARYKELKATQGAAPAAGEAPAAEPPKPPVPARPVPPPAESLTRRESRRDGRRESRQNFRQAKKNRHFPYALAAVILVAALGLVGWVYYQNHRPPDNPGGQAGQTAGGDQTGGPGGDQTGGAEGGTTGGTTGQTGGGGETTGTETGTSGQSAPDFAQLVVQTTVVNKETTSYVLDVTDLTIDVDAVERCWVRAEADGKLAFEGTIEAGHQMRWTSQTSFWVRFGNPGGVRLKVNGALVDTGPIEQAPKTYEFKSKG